MPQRGGAFQGASPVERRRRAPVGHADSVSFLHLLEAALTDDRDRAALREARIDDDVMGERRAAERTPLRTLFHNAQKAKVDGLNS
jgi:hypothetical protein